MRTSHGILDKSYEANADLSTYQFCFVKAVAGPAGGVNARLDLAEAGARTVGILQNKPSAAGLAAVGRFLGFSKLKVDGSGTAIAAGDALKPTTGGVGIKVASNNDMVGAIAMEASSASGDIIEVLVVMYQYGA